MIVFLFCFLSVCFGGSLLSHSKTVDRVVNGVQQRSYLVLLKDKGPSFGMNKEKLQDWLSATFDISPPDVQHIYEFTTFRGFSLWAGSVMLERILRHETIQYVEEDSIARVDAPFTVRPDWGQTRALQKGNLRLDTLPSGLYNTSYPSGSADTDTWNWTSSVYSGYRPINNGGSAKVWIVDTGVLQSHQEFARQGGGSRVTTSQDFVDPVNGTGTDCNGHGTHCAGSAAGNYRGVATAAEIGNIRVLGCTGSGTWANIIAGFNFVAQNQAPGLTNIMSASLSGDYSDTVNSAIKGLMDAGVIPVCSAGNVNGDSCARSPASSPDAITVMASDRTDARASFTSTGPCTNVFAPGVSIHSGWYLANDAYNTISGTSMATPLTAGSIALYASLFHEPIRKDQAAKAINDYGTWNVVTGPLLDGTPNVMINANWN